MIYTRMFSPKEVPFPGFIIRYEKGGDFTPIIMMTVIIIKIIMIIIKLK